MSHYSKYHKKSLKRSKVVSQNIEGMFKILHKKKKMKIMKIVCQLYNLGSETLINIIQSDNFPDVVDTVAGSFATETSPTEAFLGQLSDKGNSGKAV